MMKSIIEIIVNSIVLFGVPALIIGLPLALLPNGVKAIYKKEIGGYFNSSIAYVFLALFIIIPNVMFFHFFGGIFKEDLASMRRFFSMLPYVFIIFIPGLTMGSWAKEKNSGTIELLFTFPVSEWQILIGKFLAALTLVLIALFSTLFIPLLTQIFLGDFDWGQIVTQYIGVIFLSGCYIAITFFLSSLTMELIDSFLLSAALLLILTIIAYLPSVVSFPGWLEWLRKIFVWTSLSTHFSNFSKGVIDTRDILYYVGVTGIFSYLNLRSLESRKWS
ncbi:MAG: ABC transporter permease subunit [Spirochaetes bacterium]|nr:ABC transporter permease subunit [Spirochaetota bacterium]